MIFSIVVPAYNEEKNIDDCLRTIFQSNFPIERYEVIIVDNGSTDRTAEIVMTHPVKYLFVRTRNRSLARNIGFRAATGDLICYVDADVVIHPMWLSNMSTVFEQSVIDACQSEIIVKSTGEMNSVTTMGNTLSANRILGGESWPCVLDSCCSVYRKTALEDVGGFDEDCHSAEDLDLTLKLISNGKLLKWDSGTCATKKETRSLKQFIGRTFHKGIASGSLLKYRWQIISTRSSLIMLACDLMRFLISFFTCNRTTKYHLINLAKDIGSVIGTMQSKERYASFKTFSLKIFWKRQWYKLAEQAKVTIVENKVIFIKQDLFVIENADELISIIEKGHSFCANEYYNQIIENLVIEKVIEEFEN